MFFLTNIWRFNMQWKLWDFIICWRTEMWQMSSMCGAVTGHFLTWVVVMCSLYNYPFNCFIPISVCMLLYQDSCCFTWHVINESSSNSIWKWHLFYIFVECPPPCSCLWRAIHEWSRKWMWGIRLQLLVLQPFN